MPNFETKPYKMEFDIAIFDLACLYKNLSNCKTISDAIKKLFFEGYKLGIDQPSFVEMKITPSQYKKHKKVKKTVRFEKVFMRGFDNLCRTKKFHLYEKQYVIQTFIYYGFDELFYKYYKNDYERLIKYI